MIGKRYKIKSGFVFLFFFAVILVLGYRLFHIQVLGYTKYANKAKASHERQIKLEPKRGDICDRNGNALAVTLPVPAVFADPKHIKDVNETVEKLSQILVIDKNKLSKLSDKNERYVLIKRRITKEEKEKISSLKLPGISFEEKPTRFYPKGKLAAHVLGFVNIDGEGMEGVELKFNKYLKGEPGLRITEQDRKGQEILTWRSKENPPVDGYKLVLTIDEVIQYISEEELDKAMDTYNPIAAMVIVMDPNTGEVLALANRPNYDPNKYNNADKDSMRNRVVTDYFEPGSVFKMFAAAAALNENFFRLSDNINCENGAYYVPGGTLHDSSPHGMLTFQQVVEKSSNIGMAKVGQKIGKEILYKYISDFGFGKLTGISFAGETPGLFHSTRKWTIMSITRIPMGQEIAVTAMQLTAATCAIANGGQLLEPLIIKRIVDKQGRTVQEFDAKFVRNVISKDTCDKLVVALKGVASPEGTAVRASIKEYNVAGKTGTAQKRNPDGTYSHSDFMASFIGFVPADNPRIVISVILDLPKPLYYGGVVAAPVFKNIAEKVLSYLNVEPEFGKIETLVAKK